MINEKNINEIIDKYFEQNNILFRDRESLHKEDQSSINATHSYD